MVLGADQMTRKSVHCRFRPLIISVEFIQDNIYFSTNRLKRRCIMIFYLSSVLSFFIVVQYSMTYGVTVKEPPSECSALISAAEEDHTRRKCMLTNAVEHVQETI